MRTHRLARYQKEKANIALSPTRLIVSSFAAIILIGTFLLCLPVATKSSASPGFLTAFFTATSATCVTGLVLVDTYNYWSLFGQLVILTMIQVGGLGIITLTTFFSIILGRKLGLRTMVLAQESINHFSFEGIFRLIKRLVVTTLVVEVIGALLLSIRFVPQYGFVGFYLGIFHAISAFCNAGFDLMSISGKGEFLSLTQYNGDPIVLYTIALLIIIGGLGIIVWKDLLGFFTQRSKIQLHSKVVLVITAFLIIFGSLFFFAIEFNNATTMGNLSLNEKINASIFQSVTPRTAGYNSINLDGMQEISKVGTILLMFIGAAPGSTAGGIKVTTLGILLITIFSQIKGGNEVIFFKHKVHNSSINKALAIAGLGGMIIVLVTTIILAIEPNSSFINVLFEVTSAFGTVGLSTGITPSLHPVSKLLLILTMFLGRVGPVSFMIALTLRNNKKDTDTIFPDGKIVVG